MAMRPWPWIIVASRRPAGGLGRRQAGAASPGSAALTMVTVGGPPVDPGVGRSRLSSAPVMFPVPRLRGLPRSGAPGAWRASPRRITSAARPSSDASSMSEVITRIADPARRRARRAAGRSRPWCRRRRRVSAPRARGSPRPRRATAPAAPSVASRRSG